MFHFYGGIGTGIGKIWYQKKVSETVSEKFGIEKVMVSVSKIFGTGKVSVTFWVRHTLAGALSMFSTRGCVPDICPRECIKKIVPIHSLGSRKCIGYYDLWRSCHSISSLLPVNIKKYSVVNIDNVKINTSTMLREWPIFKQAQMGSCQKPGFL